MTVTLTWISTNTREDEFGNFEYYKTGTWSLNGIEQGALETPTSENFEQIVSDVDIISQITETLER